MIIETRSDVVRLSGSLHKNQWLTIKAAANLLLHEHPQGIIIDCADLSDISEEGAKTFLDAMRNIEAAKSRIMVANLPEPVLKVIRTVPGVRSQLPIAESVEAARASLRMHKKGPQPGTPADAKRGGPVILVPLLADVDLTYGADLGGRLAKVARGEVRLVYLLEVTRTLPLNAPLLEQEQDAQNSLSISLPQAKQHGIPVSENVERVREAIDGILTSIKTYGASTLVIGATSHEHTHGDNDRFHEIADALLHRAPCEVVIGRLRTK